MSILLSEPSIDNGLMYRLNRQSSDRDWIKDNYRVICKKLHGNYVAVQNKEVIYNSESVIELMSLILDNGYSTDDFVIEYLSD